MISTFDLGLTYIEKHQIAFYFASGSLFIFLLIMFIDQQIQSFFKANPKEVVEDRFSSEIDHDIQNSEHDAGEIAKGLKSLKKALEDNVINDEEFEKFKEDLIKKHQSS